MNPDKPENAYQDEMERREQYYEAYNDADLELECQTCGEWQSTANDRMLDTERECSQCWIVGNLDLLKEPHHPDPVAQMEMLDAVKRSLDLRLPIAETYERFGMPTRDARGAWVTK